MKRTIRSIAESLSSKIWGVQALREMTDAGAPMAAAAEAPVEAPAEASSEDQVKAAFRAMVIAAFDDESLDAKATLGKIKEIIAAQEKLTKKPEESETAANDDPAAGTVPESLQRRLLMLESRDECRNLLEAAGIPSDDVKLKALASLDTKTERQSLVETWDNQTNPLGRRPKPNSLPLRESQDAGNFPRTDKEAAALLRS